MAYLCEDILHRVVAVDGEVVVLVEVVSRYGLCLTMINFEAFLDGLFVVVGASAGLAAVDKAGDNLLLIYNHIQHHCLHLILLQQRRQRLCLLYGAGKTIEDNALAVGGQRGDEVLDQGNHLLIGHEITL